MITVAERPWSFMSFNKSNSISIHCGINTLIKIPYLQKKTYPFQTILIECASNGAVKESDQAEMRRGIVIKESLGGGGENSCIKKIISLSSVLSHKSFVCAISINAKKIGFVTPPLPSRALAQDKISVTKVLYTKA